MFGILAKKIGMTTFLEDSGNTVPVTVLQYFEPKVVQLKVVNGSSRVLCGFVDVSDKKLNLPKLGLFKKGELSPMKYLVEFPVGDTSYEVGQSVAVQDILEEGSFVDVRGKTKGKGYAGVIKRHGFSRGPETHGSRHHREPGSIGPVDAAKVIKGKKLPGRMGGKNVTVQHLKVVGIASEDGLIYIKGAVPGANKNMVMIKPTVKIG